jgi:hypothetical protein
MEANCVWYIQEVLQRLFSLGALTVEGQEAYTALRRDPQFHVLRAPKRRLWEAAAGAAGTVALVGAAVISLPLLLAAGESTVREPQTTATEEDGDKEKDCMRQGGKEPGRTV